MGTRHLTMAVVDGEYKVAQYGQWDGYPSGQGENIVNFITQEMDKDRFVSALRECKFLTDEAISERWVECGAKPGNSMVSLDVADRFNAKYPQLSRDTGSNVLQLIQDGARELQDSRDFAADSLFCEYAYLLDMDNEILEVYRGFNTDGMPPEGERFADMSKHDNTSTNEYYPIRLFKKIPFAELNDDTMAMVDEEINRVEEEEDVEPETVDDERIRVQAVIANMYCEDCKKSTGPQCERCKVIQEVAEAIDPE